MSTVGEPDLDVHFHGGLPSFFARAYHSRPSQTIGTDLEQHTATARTLPEYHPLLVRHADHPQQLTSRAVGGPSVHVDPAPSHNSNTGHSGGGGDMPHHESAMQQLLSNISAAAGSNEVLGFGVVAANSHRNRGEGGVCVVCVTANLLRGGVHYLSAILLQGPAGLSPLPWTMG